MATSDIEIRPGDDVLVNHPSVGSLWINEVEVQEGWVHGWIWVEIHADVPGSHREKKGAGFPVSCVRRVRHHEKGGEDE